MKVAYSEKHIVASQGIINQSGFRIQASAHAYKILSDGLYSDKQSAVLREIGCNANDAHIAAGTPHLSIEVKLPNALSPDMYIKDFGPGLSDEDVQGLYTTYFSSTKQESNDFTGAFGLGSKSPFSYTDSFTVVSVHNGVERTYTATIDDEGVPMMALMHEKPASAEWPHGVSVGFAVPPRDFAEFERKALEVYQWFTVKPTIAGFSVDKLTPKFHIDTPTFSLNGLNEAGGTCVIMGNVRYPLDASKLEFIAQTPLDLLVVSLMGQGIHLRLPIGTVQVAASREQLQYDKGSKPALVLALREAALEFSRMVNAVARARTATEWEKHIACQNFQRGFTPEMRQIVESAIAVTEKDKERAKRAAFLFKTLAATLPKEAGEAHEGKHFAVMGYHQNEKTFSSSRKTIYGGCFFRGNDRTAFASSYLSGFTIFVNDAKYSDKRMRNLVSSGTTRSALLVTPGEGSTLEDTQAYAEMLSKAMGGAPVANVSTLPEPAKRKLVKRTAAQKAQVVPSKGRVNVIYLAQDFKRRTDEPTVHQEPLNTLGDDMKYFVIKGTGSGGNASYLLTPGYQVTVSATSVKNVGLHNLVKGLRAFGAVCSEHDVLPIKGFIIVSESAIKRLKLEALGYKPLVPAVNAMATSTVMAGALEQKTRGLPYLGHDATTALDALVYATRANQQAGETARRLLKGKPMEELLVSELPAVTGAHSSKLRTAVQLLNERFAALGLPRVELTKAEMTADGVRARFLETFPLVAKVTTAQFQTSLRGGPLDEVFLQQVLITKKDIELIQALKAQQADDSVLLKAAA